MIRSMAVSRVIVAVGVIMIVMMLVSHSGVDRRLIEIIKAYNYLKTVVRGA